jgi:hypothetical protein
VAASASTEKAAKIWVEILRRAAICRRNFLDVQDTQEGA